MNVNTLTCVRVPYFVVYTKTIVLLKFGSLEIVCIEKRSKKAIQIATLPIHVKFIYMYIHTLAHVKALHFYVRL